jgi:hypothetical protein
MSYIGGPLPGQEDKEIDWNEERLLGSRVSEQVYKAMAALPKDKPWLNKVGKGLEWFADNSWHEGWIKAEEALIEKVGEYAPKIGIDSLVAQMGVGILIPGPGEARTAKRVVKTGHLMQDASRVAIKLDPISEQIKNLSKSQFDLKKTESLRLQNLFKSGDLPKTPQGLNSKQIQEFYGLSPKEMTQKHQFRYVNKGSSKNPNFQLKSTKSEAIEVELRNLRIKDVTDPDLNAKGLRKWKYINNKLGMEAHHITPIHVSSKLKQAYLYFTTGPKIGQPRPNGLANWNARVASDAKKGLFHGNDPRNIAAARGSTKIPTTEAGKRSEIYHRRGILDEDNPGYHNLEKSIKFDTKVPELVDTAPFRDLMAQQQRLKNHAMRFRDQLIGKKPTITKAP